LCAARMYFWIGITTLACTALAQLEADPECLENNGFFPDVEMCDKYYECQNGEATAKFCPDGLLFNDENPNNELCDYPFNVECGNRLYVQEPEEGLDERCPRANGYFNHEDENNCVNYYNCVYGHPHPYGCTGGLVFDEGRGTCVRKDDISDIGRKCDDAIVAQEQSIDGVTCKPALAPNGQPYAHPSFASKTSCREYIICQFGTTPQIAGCMEGLVFDETLRKCVEPEVGPEECRCWYSCPEDSKCGSECNVDCTCPAT